MTDPLGGIAMRVVDLHNPAVPTFTVECYCLGCGEIITSRTLHVNDIHKEEVGGTADALMARAHVEVCRSSPPSAIGRSD